MQTTLDAEFQNTPKGRLAEQVLRKCVHCGLCNATCPTYRLLGDELDGPRGRIYQMKQLFEEGEASRAMRLHLDRCLLCRNCETACPSGVPYASLLEIGRATLDEKLPRSALERLLRGAIARVVAEPRLFAPLLQLGRMWRGMLPRAVANKVPPRRPAPELAWPKARHSRQMIALAGCVQSAVSPATNLAAAVVLDRLGISLVEAHGAGCCGGVELHTCGEAPGRARARALIDRWWPHLRRGAEAIVMTASGCGVTVKEYGRLFEDDAEYREKARQISQSTLDLCEVVARELPAGYTPSHPSGFLPSEDAPPRKVAFHSPCTLQHGRRIVGVIEEILARAGYALCETSDAHLCCGSAGTYSLLQPKLSAQLRRDKQAALAAGRPDMVCTANIGCQLQLGVDSRTPVVHWVELLV